MRGKSLGLGLALGLGLGLGLGLRLGLALGLGLGDSTPGDCEGAVDADGSGEAASVAAAIPNDVGD